MWVWDHRWPQWIKPHHSLCSGQQRHLRGPCGAWWVGYMPVQTCSPPRPTHQSSGRCSGMHPARRWGLRPLDLICWLVNHGSHGDGTHTDYFASQVLVGLHRAHASSSSVGAQSTRYCAWEHPSDVFRFKQFLLLWLVSSLHLMIRFTVCVMSQCSWPGLPLHLSDQARSIGGCILCVLSRVSC
jgi:hypothetical protein